MTNLHRVNVWREVVRRYRIESARRFLDKHGYVVVDGNARLKTTAGSDD